VSAKKRRPIQILLLNTFAVFVLNIAALWALEFYETIVEWRKFGVNAGVDVGNGEVLLRAFHLGLIRGAAILTAITGALPALATLLIPRATVIGLSIAIWWIFAALVLTLFFYASFLAS
jgi:hypothetical protein